MKKGAVIAVMILLIGAGGATAGYYHNGGTFSFKKEEKKTVYVTPISTMTERMSGDVNRFAGIVEPQDTVSVQIDNGKKVGTVNVKVGDVVTKGQPLFEYDLSSIETSLAQARLDLENLQNQANGINNELDTYRREVDKAETDETRLYYNIEIQTKELDLIKNNYDQQTKSAEIINLENSITNTQVVSEIDGIVQKIDTSKMNGTDEQATISDAIVEDSGYYGTGENDNAFITILSTGNYKVRGEMNEMNRNDIMPGEPVIIRSRLDTSMTWQGTMGSIDNKNSKTSQNSDYYGYGGEDNSLLSSSKYPFYVDLDSSEGLMLGQHVYIERDAGQETEKKGIWIPEVFIAYDEDGEPFVWASDENNHIIKKYIKTGEHDEELSEYNITEGLSEDDCIAYPTDSIEEGMKAEKGTLDQTMNTEEDIVEDDDYEEEYNEEFDIDGYPEGSYEEEYYDEGTYDEGYYEEEYFDDGTYEEGYLEEDGYTEEEYIDSEDLYYEEEYSEEEGSEEAEIYDREFNYDDGSSEDIEVSINDFESNR